MKKNVMMRVASLLMVCVLATTCGISGTFAKYVTSDSGEDFARVAKFGVTITDNFSSMFETTYEKHSAIDGGSDDLSVKSTVDVVAPGTDGELADFTFTGTPEVDVTVEYDVTLTFTGDWLADVDGDDAIDDEYCPLIFTVKLGAGAAKDLFIDGTDIKTMAELATAVKTEIEKANTYYDAGKAMSEIANDLEVTWRWDFVKDVVTYQSDECDTDLGNWEINKDGAVAPTVTLEVGVTITQVD